MAATIINILMRDENFVVIYASGRTLTCSDLPKTAIKWAQEHDWESDKTFQVEYYDEKEPDAFVTLKASDLETAQDSAVAYLKGMTVLEVFEIDPVTYDPVIYEEEEPDEEPLQIEKASAIEEAEKAWLVAGDEDEVRKTAFQLRCLEPVAEETSLVPVEIEEAIQEAEEELGNLEYIGNPEEFGNSERLTAVKELATEAIEAIWTGAKEAGRAIVKAAPVVAGTVADGVKVAAPVIASAALTAAHILASLAYRFGLVLMDAWYWLTTYILIGARRAQFWLVWDVAPEARRAARAAARFGLDAISMAAGWALACVLWALGTAVTVAKGLAYGWSIRESILAEDRAAA